MTSPEPILTPLTNAKARDIDVNGYIGHVVPADFARTLERRAIVLQREKEEAVALLHKHSMTLGEFALFARMIGKYAMAEAATVAKDATDAFLAKVKP